MTTAKTTMAMYEIKIKRTRILRDEDAVKVRNAHEALAAVLPFFKEENSWREECHALFLDRKNNVIGHFLAGIGDEKCVVMPLRPICRAAIGVLADGVILAHNHPAGNPKPGAMDTRQTKALRKALETLEIKLIDHIIVGDGKFYSFSDQQTHEITKN